MVLRVPATAVGVIGGLDAGLVMHTGLLGGWTAACRHLHAVVELSEELLHGRRCLLLLSKRDINLAMVPLYQIGDSGGASSLRSLVHALRGEEVLLCGRVLGRSGVIRRAESRECLLVTVIGGALGEPFLEHVLRVLLVEVRVA